MDEKLMYDFHEKCHEKYLFRHIKGLVRTTKDTYREDLERKRIRLKDMIELEDKDYEEEYREMVQSRLEKTIRLRQESLVTIRNEKIRANEEFIQTKKAQQTIENSDSIRSLLRKNFLNETKLCQLAQIEENKQKRQANQRSEELWLEIQNKSSDRLHQIDEEAKVLKKELLQRNQCELLKQIESRKNVSKDTTTQFYEGDGSLFSKDAMTEEAKKKLKREQSKKNQIELFEAEELRKMLQKKKIDGEKLFHDVILRENERELQKQRDSRVNMQIENDTYRKYIKENAARLREHNQRADEEFEKYSRKVIAEQNLKLQQIKQQKEIQKKLNHKALLQQIYENDEKKLQQNIMTNEQIQAGKIITRRNEAEQDREAIVRQAKILKYRSELNQQMEERRIAREKQIEADKEELAKARKIDQMNEQAALSLITNNDQYLTAHPNWKLVTCPCIQPPK